MTDDNQHYINDATRRLKLAVKNIRANKVGRNIDQQYDLLKWAVVDLYRLNAVDSNVKKIVGNIYDENQWRLLKNTYHK